MAPHVEELHPSTLDEAVNVTAGGKLRKRRVDLDECTLARMLQYRCEVVLEPHPYSQSHLNTSTKESECGSVGAGSSSSDSSSSSRRQTMRPTTVCYPVERLFRRCAGGLTVETTSWEQPRP